MISMKIISVCCTDQRYCCIVVGFDFLLGDGKQIDLCESMYRGKDGLG